MCKLVVLCSVLALASCSKKSGDEGSGGAAADSPCSLDKAGLAQFVFAVRKLGEESSEDIPNLSVNNDAASLAVKAVLSKHCIADKWSAEVVKCMTAMESFDCLKALPAAQKTAILNDSIAVTKDLAPKP